MNDTAPTMRRPVFDRAVRNLRNFHRLKISRTSLAIVCLVLTAIIGYVDYLTGYEHSLLLFYFLPISLAGWFGNFAFGIIIVAVCVMIWGLADLASRILEHWNGFCLVRALYRCSIEVKNACSGTRSACRRTDCSVRARAGGAAT